MRTIKALGQHWLKDEEIIERILSRLNEHGVLKNDHASILEVGPGAGALSKPLLEMYKEKIYFSEVDQRAIAQLLRDGISKDKLLGDFLAKDIQLPPAPVLVIGNFPYNISSQILFRIIDQRLSIPYLLGMFQKEVAERVASAHGRKSIGILSVLCQAFYTVEKILDVPPSAFIPPPKVESAVIELKRRESALCGDADALRLLLKVSFSQRRKKLSNVLKGQDHYKSLFSSSQLSKRAEELSVEEWCEIVNSSLD